MPKQTFLLVVAAGCLAGLGGCPRDQVTPESVVPPAPPYLAATVAEYATLDKGRGVPVTGYGAVIGLGSDGSTTIPPHLEPYFDQALLKRGLASYRRGTRAVTPTKFLQDPDTAIVFLSGLIPPGAPRGTRFDVPLTALPGTQTRSLAGGVLMPTELRFAFAGQAVPGGPTRALAHASGPVFINPFLDPTDPAELAKFREGRIVAGGTVVEARTIRLRLRDPDWSRCMVIERKINQRFSGIEKVAKALNSVSIELRIPDEFRDERDRFLDLVMHLPLHSGSASMETRARDIAEQMKRLTAPHNGLGLIWEAMGREILPVVQTLYASESSPGAFFAGRTGLRLGDKMAADVLMRFAAAAGEFQIPAIEELGRVPSVRRAVPVLRRLLEDDNELVRVAAYEALLKHGDRQSVTRIDVSGQFKLDLVNSYRGYVVYATQVQRPKIVLFGKDMKVVKPVFFSPNDEMVTVNARMDDEKLMVFRKIPRSGGFSDTLRIDFYVRSLISTLGNKPERDAEGEFKGLGLTYGQVVRVLYQMCKRGDIPGKFVLQPLPEMQKIYRRAVGVGRPETPGS